MLKLTYFGHACFALEAEGYRVLMDPYAPGYVPGLGRLTISANRVLCSHDHADHNWAEGIPMPLNLLPEPFTVRAIPCFHDDRKGALRGPNTIHVLEYQGIRVAHFGDLGHGLDEAAIDELGELEAALLPVGGTYTIDCRQAAELADRLRVRTVIPMHYRRGSMGFAELQCLREFLELRPGFRELSGSTLELTRHMPRETLMMQPWWQE